ncbi:HRDC domain-containing protein [Corynebacterium diphtheriae]|uniref:HRDC domain-containing protein n=1 Tax=Corynebacterium diphtheriae TaxID=1717 RepID=UPI0009D0FBB2|nr:HRDC domain-containing protein [Corynebacterium diphtheriae]MBG9316100.1 HRDC domain-containing protein [Corynebacterium diphtheriae bv. mitis]OMO47932.1 ribonuclease [Corynebacterium diphtheriae]OMO48982.1 ribonuclease [Corynebacterium diphtheriae]RKW84385.1 ribonuclease [Corynebacterium diphtheriae]RKW94276.1 ribonuclease [Corynebacterium diphtheriae]
MALLVTQPSEGLPPLAATSRSIYEAAYQLSQGTGPFAIDTERAGAYRYDDRAYLLQIRREGSGTVLIDPEANRRLVTSVLGKVINNQPWIIHAAATDLPCLSELGFYPSTIFDTELAGRLAGLPRVNLASMLEERLEVTLKKAHGAEDWSRRPLPHSWLVYAALDVEKLIPLAESMKLLLEAHGKLEWHKQECAHLINTSSHGLDTQRSWQDMKGVSRLTRPRQLVVAEALWELRDDEARMKNTSVSRLLPDKVLISVALRPPRNSQAALRASEIPKQYRKRIARWMPTINDVLESDPRTWPHTPQFDENQLPSKYVWEKIHPESLDDFEEVKNSIVEKALLLNLPAENLMQPHSVKELCWQLRDVPRPIAQDDVIECLMRLEARPWQIDNSASVITDTLNKIEHAS